MILKNISADRIRIGAQTVYFLPFLLCSLENQALQFFDLIGALIFELEAFRFSRL